MERIKVKIGNLFKAIEQLEGHIFEYDKPYEQESKIKIQNEKREFCNVPCLIKKSDLIANIKFSDGSTISVGYRHKFIVNNEGEEIFAFELSEGSSIFTCDNKELIVIENDSKCQDYIPGDDNHITTKVKDVFDLQIDSPTNKHWYITPNGIIHHNTFCMFLLTKVFPNTKIMLLFSSIDLIMQTYEIFTKEYHMNPNELGVIQGNNREDEKRVTLISIFSYQKAFHLFNDVKIAISDEAHETGVNDTSEIILFSMQNCSMKFGFSATPKHDNPYRSMKLFANIGPVIYRKRIKEQIEIGTLSKTGITIYSYDCPEIPIVGHYSNTYDLIKVDEDNTEKKLKKLGYYIINKKQVKYGKRLIELGDESNHYVENIIRNKIIVNIAKNRSKQGKRVLILFNKRRHGENLQKLLENENILVHGKNNKQERKDTIEYLRNNPGGIVIASSIFNQGIDIEELDVYINAGGGVSSQEVIQKLGRVIRKSNTTNKTIAEVIDLDDSCLSPLGKKQTKTRIQLYEDEELPIMYEQLGV